MKNILSICYFLFVVQIGTSQESTAKTAVKDLVSSAVNKKEVIGVSVGIISTDNRIWTNAKGYSDRDLNTPFTATTISRIASISKPITATAIMQLVEKGTLDIDTEVSKYLEIFDQEELKNITVRQILQHTSGFSGYTNKSEAANTKQYDSFEDALKIVINKSLLFKPGTGFNYSSYGYNVAGLLIEKTTDMSFETYLQKHIFEPAGMKNTSLEKFGQDLSGKSKVYHQKKPGKIKEITNSNISDRLAGGGIQSTLEDLLKFGQALLNNTLISSESFNEMIIDHKLKKEGNGYGMGFYLYGDNAKLGNIVGHNGAQYGCTSFLFLAPEKGLVTAVLSNTSNYNGHGTLAMTAFSLGNELE